VVLMLRIYCRNMTRQTCWMRMCWSSHGNGDADR
jgi:hypothetical protein